MTVCTFLCIVHLCEHNGWCRNGFTLLLTLKQALKDPPQNTQSSIMYSTANQHIQWLNNGQTV